MRGKTAEAETNSLAENGATKQNQPVRFVLEAVKLDNLIETSRLRLLSDSEGSFPATPSKTRKFLRDVSSIHGIKRNK
jgi:hypothetical protein